MISLMRTKKDFWLDKPIKRAQPLSRNRPEGVEYTLCGTFAKIYKTRPRKLYNRAHQDLHPAQSRGKNPELGRIQLKSHRLLKKRISLQRIRHKPCIRPCKEVKFA